MTAPLAWPETDGTSAHDDRRDVLAALDLNMLPALRALLQERSVTRAAARLGLRQPAASAALRRLRTHFNDPLLVRTGNTYQLSRLAAVLLAEVEPALAAAEAVLLERTAFAAKSSRRRFTIMAADGDLMPVAEKVMRRLADSPGITLDIIPLSTYALEDPERTFRKVDLLLMPHGAIAGYPSQSLWEDQWVVIAGHRTAIAASRVTAHQLSAMTWVESCRATLPVTAALDGWGIRPHVQVSVPSTALLPALLRSSTQHVAILQRRVAERLHLLGGIRLLDGPTPVMRLRMAQWWHPTRHHDAGHLWLRNVIRHAARDLDTKHFPLRDAHKDTA